MNGNVWWSASPWFVVFVAGEPSDEVESVVLLRAPEGDWDAAFERALETGYGMERSYLNGQGEEVAWRLGGVLTLDQLGAEIAEGSEVYFTRRSLPSADLRADDLRPNEARPTQSGV